METLGYVSTNHNKIMESCLLPGLLMRSRTCAFYDGHCTLHAQAALHCWLLISFCFTSSFSYVSATSLVMFTAADASPTAHGCIQINETAENSHLGACPAQDVMDLSCPSQDPLSYAFQISLFRSELQRSFEYQCLPSSEIPPSILRTIKLNEIAVDYGPEVCHHNREEDEIAITFDERGGARWRTLIQFKYGTFSGRIKCPDGNTSGLNCSFYLSSPEGGITQDEIDFEFLGKDKGIVQTNYYVEGTGHREQIHLLGFECSEDFHEYTIKWSPVRIEWSVDGKILRTEEVKQGERFPSKRMYLYASVWNASYVDDQKWAGPYFGNDAPYICRYRDVHIPVVSEVRQASLPFNL